MANVLDVILKTIEDVQQKNKNNPNEPTAAKSVFDLLKKEIGKLDSKIQNKEMQKGKRNPKSILEMIRDGIEGVRKQNAKDPKVKTAPKSVFDELKKHLEKKPQRQANAGIRRIIEDYNLDVRGVPQDVMRQIQDKYSQDFQHLNKQYAQAIHQMVNQARRRR